jgi:uncharacterized phage-associated protein
MKVIELSDYIINYCGYKQRKISNITLQKILYFVQGYYVSNFGKPLFDERIDKWGYGPTVPYAFYHFATQKFGDERFVTSTNYVILPLNKKEIELIDLVIEHCLSYRPSSLVALSQETLPVSCVDKGDTISTVTMKYYFREKNPLDI